MRVVAARAVAAAAAAAAATIMPPYFTYDCIHAVKRDAPAGAKTSAKPERPRGFLNGSGANFRHKTPVPRAEKRLGEDGGSCACWRALHNRVCGIGYLSRGIPLTTSSNVKNTSGLFL